jgi:hypothetical protein
MIASLPAASNSQNITVILFNNATDERALRSKISLGRCSNRTFRCCLLLLRVPFFAYSLTLKMEAVHSSKMSVNFYQNIRRHVPESSQSWCWARLGPHGQVFKSSVWLLPFYLWRGRPLSLEAGSPGVRYHGQHVNTFIYSIYNAYSQGLREVRWGPHPTPIWTSLLLTLFHINH